MEEHMRTAAPEHFRKISLLLVLGKPLLDGKRSNWATNTFCCRYEPYEEVSFCNIHVIPKCLFDISHFSEERTSVNDNDFKIYWANYCSIAVLDIAKWNL